MNTLTAKDAKGFPTLFPIDLGDPSFSPCPRIFCTMVVKKKNPIKYKARLCARGDMLRSTVNEDVSAPTVARSAPPHFVDAGQNI